MSKLIFKFKKDPKPHPTEVTQEEKAALADIFGSVTRIIDREQRGELKETERLAEDYSDLWTFKNSAPKRGRVF